MEQEQHVAKHVIAIIFVLVSLAVLGFSIVYWMRTNRTPVPVPSTLITKTPASYTLTSEELRVRAELIKSTEAVTPAKLTPEQLRVRKQLIESTR